MDYYDAMPKTTVGLYVAQLGYGPTCDRILVKGNRVFAHNKKLDSGTNHLWRANDSRTCPGAKLEANIIGDRSLSTSIWDL